MDNIEIVLYIIFVVIAILTRAFKGKKKNATPPRQQSASEEPSSQSQPPQKPMSFEDLLKEFTGEKQKEEPAEGSYEYETEYTNDEEAHRVYEDSVEEAKELKTIDELVDLGDDRHTGSFKHFDGYEEQDDDVPNVYAELMRDAEGAKKAIILSEIINKKYN